MFTLAFKNSTQLVWASRLARYTHSYIYIYMSVLCCVCAHSHMIVCMGLSFLLPLTDHDATTAAKAVDRRRVTTKWPIEKTVMFPHCSLCSAQLTVWYHIIAQWSKAWSRIHRSIYSMTI